VGVYLVVVGGWPILAIGVVSVALAVLYTGGPFPLAYHGLGDVFVLVFFGPVAVGGTYYVQVLSWPPDVWLAGAALGALSTALLVVNNLRDIDTDQRAGKRTLAVRLGPAGTRAEYVALLLVAAVVPAIGVTLLGWPVATSASLLGAPLCWAPLRTVHAYQDPRELIPALGATARVLALYGLLLTLGLGLG
jgi:1,4-dihydroxy-2-naphthoate octaprenyltransferase